MSRKIGRARGGDFLSLAPGTLVTKSIAILLRSLGKMLAKLMNICASFAIILFGAAALCYGGELIEPTRTLQDAGERWGKLVIFSEPPELDVFLDGSRIGQTPVRLERVKEGTYKLQIKDLEKELYVKAGRTLKGGLFKGRKERTSAAGRNSLTEA